MTPRLAPGTPLAERARTLFGGLGRPTLLEWREALHQAQWEVAEAGLVNGRTLSAIEALAARERASARFAR